MFGFLKGKKKAAVKPSFEGLDASVSEKPYTRKSYSPVEEDIDFNDHFTWNDIHPKVQRMGRFDDDFDDLYDNKASRAEYLADSKAVLTSVEDYALFIELYVRQGGIVSLYGGKMNDFDRFWTPQDDSVQVPAGYGSMSLSLFFVPELTGNLPQRATDHWMEGWEFGHSKLFFISFMDNDPRVNFGFKVASNSDTIVTYKDVEVARDRFGLNGLVKLFCEKRNISPAGLLSLEA